MALATLSIDLEAKLAKLQEGFDKAGRMSAKTAADIERQFGNIKGGAVAIGGALAGAFVSSGIVSFFRSTVDGLDALNDLKDATGASIENISALEDVALRTGTSFETVASSLVKFNKVLGDAKAGSETANILKQIGLNAEELKRLDPAEALRQTAVALSQFADDGDKARVVQALFGKSVQEAAPFLKDLAAAGQLNATVTTAQAEEAEKFNKQLASLQKNTNDAARSLTSELVPALNNMFDRVKSEGGYLEALFTDDLSTHASRLGGEVKRLTSEYEKLAVARGARQASGDDLGPRELAKMKELRAEIEGLQKQTSAVNARVKQRLGQPVADGLAVASYSNEGRSPSKAIGGIAEADKAAGKDKLSEFQKYLQQLEQARVATRNLNEEEKAQYAIATGALGNLNAKQKERLILLAKSVDLARNVSDQKIDFSAIDALIEQQRQLEALIASTPTAELERQRDLQISLAAAYEAGRFGIVGSTEAMAAYTAAVQTALPGLKKLEEETNTFAVQAAANIQDALGSTVKGALKGDFDDIGDLWKNLLLDMASQAASAQIAKALFGGDYGKSGELGGLIGGIAGWFKGAGTGTTAANAMPGNSLDNLLALNDNFSARASGGPVSSGGLYRVNERGPEVLTENGKDFLMMGANAGNVTPNHLLGGRVQRDFGPQAKAPVVKNDIRVINNAGAQVETRTRETDFGQIVELVIDRAAQDVASGGGKIATAMKSRGLNLSGNLPRRR